MDVTKAVATSHSEAPCQTGVRESAKHAQAARLKAAASKPHPIHAAADSLVPKFEVALRYAFAMGRRALSRTNPDPDKAATAIKAALTETLRPLLLKAVVAGGQVGVARVEALTKQRAAGGVGSGNFGHAGRPGEVGGSAPVSGDAARFNELKARWSRVNDQLFKQIDNPTTSAARALIEEQKNIIKEIHTLEADPGGLEGIGMPGGPRDVVVIGAGPGGYAAAVMGGAEGLDTLLVETQAQGGGQAKFSSRVENLPGFPVGVTGEKLAASMHDQAERMGAELHYGVSATGITYDPTTGLKTVSLSDGGTVEARTVIVAGGVQFKRADFPGADSNTVSYGDSHTLASMGVGKQVVVAGGSNGAAQAALLAAQQSEHVTVVSRHPIENSMSDYQVRALRNHPRITVMEGEEIAALKDGRAHLKSGGEVGAGAVGIFFGGRPQTDWLPKAVRQEKNGKIITNDRLETDIPGVFAVGDVRSGSIGRIGMAIGEGQLATHGIFKYFERLKSEGVLKKEAVH